MKLFLLTCGSIRMKRGVFTPGQDDDHILDIPLPVFLIKHPSGNVLFDTGIRRDTAEAPLEHWGGMAKAFRPSMLPEQHVLTQLASLGVSHTDIRYVIISHLHMDHAGNNRFFPNARIIVREEEMCEASKPENEGKGYYKSDWRHNLDYQLISKNLDLFGDGRVCLEHLPGHTPGLQIAVLDLPVSGKIVLASDAAALSDNLLQGIVARNIYQLHPYLDSLHRLQELHKSGALIICGHDPQQWNSLKLAPAYYE